MHVYEVLRRPVVTEKSMDLADQGKYVFEVDRRSNKHQIKDAVEEVFDVTVVSVNVVKMPPKRSRYGRRVIVKEPAWKKAIVTLTATTTPKKATKMPVACQPVNFPVIVSPPAIRRKMVRPTRLHLHRSRGP